MRNLLFLLTISATAYAQSASAPRFGFTTEGNQLVPVWGIPGSARLGTSIAPPEGVKSLLLHPARELALAVCEGSTGILDLTSGTFEELIAAAPAAAAWSPAGKALVMAHDGQIEVFTEFDSRWRKRQATTGSPDAVAVSDDGLRLLIRTGEKLALWQEGDTHLAGQGVRGFVFTAGDNFVYQTADELVFSNSRLEARRVATEEDTLLTSHGEGFVIVSRAAAGSIIEYRDAQGELLSSLSGPGAVDSLQATGGGWIRLRSSGDSGPLWFTDGRQLFFVPASAAGEVQ
jgi:hypothetical protein